MISRMTATHAAFPQCTSYSVRPLYPRDSGKQRLSCSHSCTPPLLMTIKGGGGFPLARLVALCSGLSGFSLPRERPRTTEHSSQPTPLLAETWELPSLSRLACIPYYKHSGCKIIQCPRTPLCWTYGLVAGTRINRALLCCLLHHHLGRGNTQHSLVGIQAPWVRTPTHIVEA